MTIRQDVRFVITLLEAILYELREANKPPTVELDDERRRRFLHDMPRREFEEHPPKFDFKPLDDAS